MNLIVPVSYFFNAPRSEIWHLDTLTGRKEKVVTLEKTGREVRGKGITGLAWLDHSNLVACDFNRLFKLNSKSYKLEDSFEDCEFNDLHSLSVSNGYVYVANTGRDSIDVFNSNLELIERIDCLTDQELAKRKAGDYYVTGSYFDEPKASLPFHKRRVPDRWHFNHVFKSTSYFDDKVIATCFSERCLVDVHTLQQISSALPIQPHDGVLYKDYLWVTTVSGQIYRALKQIPFKFELVLDLFTKAAYQGWCRGLYIEDNVMYIGITAIYEVGHRTRWLDVAIDETRSGIYKVNLVTSEIEEFYDFSSVDGARIFTMIADK